MQTYNAKIICRESTSPGFSCEALDEVNFNYAGDMLTNERAGSIINDEEHILKRCWKCFAQNWRVSEVTPIFYQARAQTGRT